jgi:hypothetical protein
MLLWHRGNEGERVAADASLSKRKAGYLQHRFKQISQRLHWSWLGFLWRRLMQRVLRARDHLRNDRCERLRCDGDGCTSSGFVLRGGVAVRGEEAVCAISDIVVTQGPAERHGKAAEAQLQGLKVLGVAPDGSGGNAGREGRVRGRERRQHAAVLRGYDG